MRDLNRMFNFCSTLAKLWHDNCPDMRFGQLMMNVLGEIYNETGTDPFFIEDDKMINLLTKIINKYC